MIGGGSSPAFLSGEQIMHARKREPSSKRRFIAKETPAPIQAAADPTIPAFGQRKNPKKRRPMLAPLPAKAD